METGQIIIFLLLSISSTIAYFGALLTKDEAKRTRSIHLLLFCIAVFALISVISTIEMNSNKIKCPELERIENVYRLK